MSIGSPIRDRLLWKGPFTSNQTTTHFDEFWTNLNSKCEIYPQRDSRRREVSHYNYWKRGSSMVFTKIIVVWTLSQINFDSIQVQLGIFIVKT